MSSINNSDVTYCSEVEELIKATCVLKKCGQNVAVRRSQRLSQKPKVTEGLSWNNVQRITKNGVVFKTKEKTIPCSGLKVIANKHACRSSKCTQDYLNRSEINHEQVLLYPEFACKLNVNTVNNHKKMVKNEDVPLDLSHKSKVSKQTSQGELDIIKMPDDLKTDKVKSVMDKAEETTKDSVKQKKKRGRPKKVRAEETCLTDNRKSLKVERELEDALILLETGPQTGKNKNNLQDHVKVNTSRVPVKITKLKQVPNNTANFSSKKSDIIKPATKKLSQKYKGTLNNRNSKIKQSKTVISANNGENINNDLNTQLVERQNSTVSNSKTKGKTLLNSLACGTLDLCNYCPKPLNSCNSNLQTKVFDKTKGNLTSVEPQINDFYLKSKHKTSNNNKTKARKDPLSKTFNCSKETSLKNIKRSCGTLVLDKNIPLECKTSNSISRKRIKSVENLNSIKLLTKELPLKSLKRSCGTLVCNKGIQLECEDSNAKCRKRIKKLLNENNEGNNSENLMKPMLKLEKTKLPISQDIFEKFSNETQTIKRSQNTKLSGKRKVAEYSSSNELRHIKSEQLTPKFSVLANTSNNSGEKKSSKNSQKCITANENNNLLEDNIKGIPNFLTKNLKSKEIVKKSSNKTGLIKNSQHLYLTRSNNKKPLPGQTQKIETKELNNHDSESFKTNFKTLSEVKPPKTETITQQYQKSDESIAKKSKDETEKTPALNKNYLKSFDKTLFLDKLQTTKANHNMYDATNLLQIPPTPADSTQELWKKSLLPDNYPSHFKYQLPTEATLTHSSNEQFQPVNVITPDDTPALELLESSSSSPSLPESLCELFQTKDIKDILNVDKVSYRLYDYHVQALALTLNLSLDYLLKILDKIMKIQPQVLKNIDKAVKMPFVPDCDLFVATPEEQLWASGEEMVCNSQNSKKRRVSVIGSRI